jgi:hypothetical protein
MKKTVLLLSIALVALIGTVVVFRITDPVRALMDAPGSTVQTALETEDPVTSALSASDTILLADESEPDGTMSDRDKVIMARGLWRDLIRLHLDNMDLMDILREDARTLKATGQAFREGGYELSDEDKDNARAIVSALKDERTVLRDIHGDAREILEGLRGTVSLENIDAVIEGLESAILVLETRHESFVRIGASISEAQALLDTHMA